MRALLWSRLGTVGSLLAPREETPRQRAPKASKTAPRPGPTANEPASVQAGTATTTTGGIFTFRTSITLAVMTFVTALAGLLIFIQFWTFRLAAQEAASARMDAASAETLGRLRSEISEVTSIVDVLSSSSSVADSDERSENGRAIPLFKAALLEVPQIDSIYVGYDNGAWLQVRPLSHLNEEQRTRLRVPNGAAFVVNLI